MNHRPPRLNRRVFAALIWLAVPPALAADDSVTTTFLPDPFPNVAPKALDRDAVLEVNTPATTPSALLGVYDVENDPLTVASFTQPAHGAAALNKDGTFTYTPKTDFVGDDQFQFVLSDGRGGQSTATMRLQVIQPSEHWATTTFTNLTELQAGGEPVRPGRSAVVPRAVDWDADGKIDLLVAADGGIWWYRNTGTPKKPQFAAGVRVQVNGKDLQLGKARLSFSCVDMDGDGKKDLVAIPADDRKVRLMRNTSAAAGVPVLAAPVILKDKAGADLVAADVRADVADWNGDGLPDLLTGTQSGTVKVAYNAGPAADPTFEAPQAALDADGRTIDGSYKINVRVADLDADGRPDLVDSYNWGTVHFRINTGTPQRPRLPETGSFGITGPQHAKLDLHSLTDGPIVDFADFNGDGTLDVIMGNERGGPLRLALGEGGQAYLKQFEDLIAAHPQDLGPSLADPANAAAKERVRTLTGGLYDYVVGFATPSQKSLIGQRLAALIKANPQYFKLQTHDTAKQPGLPALSAQVWLTVLMTGYHQPATRTLLADAAQFTGGYRTLLEADGLIYADNMQNPRGADAIHQWLRTVPREIYPGTCITAGDWLGDRTLLVRGHNKNTFNGKPVDQGEYGFGRDARGIIGDRGSENWFMTVVHHEASHDLDAYVRKSPAMTRRWGQVLVRAGGPDMRADPQTGWFSMELTRQHFRQAGWWDGKSDSWEAAWKKYWDQESASGWREYGFMRGNIPFFYAAPQESLASQGNQYFNTTEGRIQVAIDRWRCGYKSNLGEVLFFIEVWSLGLDKVKFYENDNACRQVIGYAALHRNADGHIDRIDLGDRRYAFTVDADGAVTGIVEGVAKP